MPKLSRRRFLQTAAVATAATQFAPHLRAETATAAIPYPENGTLIPDEGWHLWIDEHAAWQNDDLFLPEEISRDANGTMLGRGQPLPVNAPTGGWGVLRHDTGLEVTLPTTVEQHSWGQYGAGADGKPRPYTPDEYRYACLLYTSTKYAVMNLQGRVFMSSCDDPFRKADELLAGIAKNSGAKVILLDIHGEATSEKAALGWYLDGRLTAVLGTHTHVPTADERILFHGTAYQTDVGMSGPFDSVIGVETELSLKKFLTGMPGKFE